MAPLNHLNWYQRKIVVLLSAVFLVLQLPERASGIVCDEPGFYGDPGSCTTFWVCSPDGATSFDCNPGLIWNEGAKRCDWPYNTVCDKDPTKTTVKTTTSATTTATTTPSPSTSSSTESTTSSSTTSVTTTSTTPTPTTTETTPSPSTSSSSSTTTLFTTPSTSSSSSSSFSSTSSSSSSAATNKPSTTRSRESPATTAEQPVRTQQCKNRMDGFYPNWMKQCTEYFLCMGGTMTNRRKCSYGLVFDVFTAKCQRKENVKPPCGTYSGDGSNGAFSANSASHWTIFFVSVFATSSLLRML